MKKIIGNQQLARITNQKLILDTIREKGSVSRADLVKILHMSAPTVSCNIEKLMELGVLNEAGMGASNGGRKPILLEFNYNYGNIIGIDLSGGNMKIALSNLKPEILEEGVFEIPDNLHGRYMLSWMIGQIDEMLENNRPGVKQLMVVSIAFPGVVNGVTGHVETSRRFAEWSELDVRQIFEEHFQVPLLINNDINNAVLGELMYGCGSGYENLIYIGVDVGIGAGLVINGSLYEGSHFNAGELSKLVLGPDINNLSRDEEVYLESVVSVTRIVSDIREKLRDGYESRVRELVNGDVEQIGFDHIVTALKQGDPFCIAQIKHYGEILGIIIVNLVNVLDVEVVIIGNEIVRLGNPLIEEIQTVVKDHVVIPPLIVYSKLNTDTVLYGTFAVSLDHVFQHLIK